MSVDATLILCQCTVQGTHRTVTNGLLTGVVQEVFDRHSEMSDPAMANVDLIILVMSLNLPPFDARQATRFLVSAEAASIPVMLLLNKADLLEEDMTTALVAEVCQAQWPSVEAGTLKQGSALC